MLILFVIAVFILGVSVSVGLRLDSGVSSNVGLIVGFVVIVLLLADELANPSSILDCAWLSVKYEPKLLENIFWFILTLVLVLDKSFLDNSCFVKSLLNNSLCILCDCIFCCAVCCAVCRVLFLELPDRFSRIETIPDSICDARRIGLTSSSSFFFWFNISIYALLYLSANWVSLSLKSLLINCCILSKLRS